MLTGAAWAEDDDKGPDETLRPVTFQNFAPTFDSRFSKAYPAERLQVLPCLDGDDAQKPKVCSFRLGGYLSIILASEKGGPALVGLTMMCGTQQVADAAKCHMAFVVAINMTATTDIERSGKILDVLVGAMSLGHDARITTDNRQYVMQAGPVIGLSFYVNAASSWEVDQ
jgi:hypothetical protein